MNVLNSIFVDACIFLEVQLDQQKVDECSDLLKYLEKPPLKAWTNSFLLYSMILTVLHKTNDIAKAKILIQAINSYKGLKIYHPSSDVCFSAILGIEKQNLDFDDSLVVSSMNKLGISNIVTFDKHFTGLTDINVLLPRVALQNMKK